MDQPRYEKTVSALCLAMVTAADITRGNSTDILVKASNDGNMAWSRLGWYTRVRYAPGTGVLNDVSQIRGSSLLIFVQFE